MNRLLLILLICFAAHGQRTPRVVDSVAALVALTPSATAPDVVVVDTNANTRLQFRYYPGATDATNAATPFIYSTATGTGRWKEVPPTGTVSGITVSGTTEFKDAVDFDAASTIDVAFTYSAAPVLANEIWLKAKDSGGTARDLIGKSSGDFVRIGSGSGAERINIQPGTGGLYLGQPGVTASVIVPRVNTANATNPLRNSQIFAYLGSYWNGSAEVQYETLTWLSLDSVSPAASLYWKLGGTDRMRLKSDGTLYIGSAATPVATAPDLSTITVQASKFVNFISAGAGAVTVTLPATGLPVWAYSFNDSADSKIAFMTTFPPGWNGTTLTATFHWLAAATSGDCVWAIQARYARDGDNIDSSFGTIRTAIDSAQPYANYQSVSASTAAIVPSGTYAAGCPVYFIVYRDADSMYDSMSGPAMLVAVVLTWK